MKHTILFSVVALLLYTSGICAQSNVSTPMDFYIVHGIIPPVLNIVGQPQFIDTDDNGVIDANETCKIRFDVANTGRGDGYGCIAHVEVSGTNQGLIIKDVKLPTIPNNDRITVEIPITANVNTVTGSIQLKIVVNEPNGYGTEEIKMIVGTHKLKTPDVQVASYKVVGSTSGVLERRKPFTLQIAIQNIDQGVAEYVQCKIQLPANVNWMGGDQMTMSIPSLHPGETKRFEYELIANQTAEEQLNIEISLSEKQGKYAKNTIVPLQLGQHIGGTIQMDIARHDNEVEIHKTSLISTVDENIPETDSENNNTFVVIIANENYQSVANVPYALNDGNIFREYCIKTLGIPENNIKYKPNATGNQIKAQINWLQDVTNVFDDVHIIFYYAGHGFPDEQSKTAYLLPIDGIGTDITTGYKLDNLYANLGKMNAKNITIFMDACFSGSKRENGMLVSARGIALKAKVSVPQGNMVVFSAAQGDETAYPNENEGHGLFTYYLLKKLQETKGDVTLNDLSNYITTQVRQQSILLNGKSQTPCVTPSATLGAEWQGWKLR